MRTLDTPAGADRQRADGRRRGLFPGLGVRRAHPARDVGHACRAASSATSTASSSCSTSADVQRHVLHAGLDRRALSRSWSAASSTRATSSQATATSTSGPPSRRRGAVPRRHPARQGGARGHRAARGEGLSRAELLDRRRAIRGRSTACRSRLSLQLQHLSDPPRSLRHAGCAALRARRCARLARGAGRDGAHVRAQLAGGRRRLFPAAAVCACRAGRSAASTRVDRQAGDVLFPSVGARSRAAARRRRRRQDAFSPLRQPRPHGAAPATRCSPISAGTAWTACSWTAAHDANAAASEVDRIATRGRRTSAVRPLRRRATRRAGTPSSQRCPRRRSSTASAGARSSRTSSAIAPTTSRRARRRRSSACCRWRRSRAGCSAIRWCRCRSASTAARRRPTPKPRAR